MKIYDQRLKKTDQIQTSGGTVILRPDGIIRIEIGKIDEISLKNVNEFIEAIRLLGEGKAYCNLIIFEDFVQVDHEARKYTASEEANIYTTAEALVIKSTPLKLVGNFYIKFNKPSRPTKIFTNEDDAVKWLKTFM